MVWRSVSALHVRIKDDLTYLSTKFKKTLSCIAINTLCIFPGFGKSEDTFLAKILKLDFHFYLKIQNGKYTFCNHYKCLEKQLHKTVMYSTANYTYILDLKMLMVVCIQHLPAVELVGVFLSGIMKVQT
jgi:hypothetical protein